MAFDRDHMLFQWFGTFSPPGATDAEESFSGSLRFAADPGDGGTSIGAISAIDNDDAGAQVASKLAAWWATTQSAIPKHAHLQTYKWNRIGTNGKYVNDTTREGSVGSQIRGVRDAAYPTQIACVATYGTGVRRGLAKAGRTYFPTAIGLTGDTLSITGTQSLAMATSLAQLLDSMGNWSGFDLSPAVPCVMSKQGAGKTRKITEVRVGDQLDYMGSRKQKPEKYSIATVAPA